MKFSLSTPDTRQLSQPGSEKMDIFCCIKVQRGTRHFTGHSLQPVRIPLICRLQPLCSLLTGKMLRIFAATTTHSILFWNKKSPAPCWLANCQRAMAGKGFTLKPQRISGHIQTTKSQPGAVLYKKTIFWFWTLPSALKSSPGIVFLFDSLKKTTNGRQRKEYKPIELC